MILNEKKTACITGATSGIGAAYAKEFAKQGYDLVITGRRKEKIESFSNSLKKEFKINVEVIIAELSNNEDVDRLTKYIKEDNELEILVNNAGFTIESYFHKSDLTATENMVKVHNISLIQLCHAAIPNMLLKGSGTIINVSSLGAFMPLPLNAVYSASKSFIKLFTESIHLELKGTGVKAQVLCPGMTKTDFHEKLGYDKSSYYKEKGLMKAMSPEEVVEESLNHLKEDKAVCIPGRSKRIFSYLVKILPRSLIYKSVSSAMNAGDKT